MRNFTQSHEKLRYSRVCMSIGTYQMLQIFSWFVMTYILYQPVLCCLVNIVFAVIAHKLLQVDIGLNRGWYLGFSINFWTIFPQN